MSPSILLEIQSNGLSFNEHSEQALPAPSFALSELSWIKQTSSRFEPRAQKAVLMSLVKAGRNPPSGEVVVADVTVQSAPAQFADTTDPRVLLNQILETLRRGLAVHRVGTIRFVPSLETTRSGKLAPR